MNRFPPEHYHFVDQVTINKKYPWKDDFIGLRKTGRFKLDLPRGLS